MERSFWRSKKVFVTGHTGFKGAWLCQWLHRLGARVSGFALAPPTEPNLFGQANVAALLEKSVEGDVRDLDGLCRELLEAAPEIVIHMAAQPLVRDSYKIPVETYATNVLGTVHLLEAVRRTPSVRAVVNVTTDKCYENREWYWGYRESEAMGGYDPYSSSKGCSELVTSAYRNSFFNPAQYAEHGVALASARAGNVIGGGDWAVDRLIPDCLRALLSKDVISIRSPHAIRPWQHVLEPLSGYMILAEKLYSKGSVYASGWNFGPVDEDARPVEWIVKELCRLWGGEASYKIDDAGGPHEATYLKLDCSKARTDLGWRPRWNLEKALARIVDWTLSLQAGQNMQQVCMRQIDEYAQQMGEIN